MKKALNPNVKSVIQTALAHPAHYLGDLETTGVEYDAGAGAGAGVGVGVGEKDKETEKKKRRAPPDACIMFKLYLECGKNVSLHELYTTFSLELEHFYGTLGLPELRFDDDDVSVFVLCRQLLSDLHLSPSFFVCKITGRGFWCV